MDGKYVDGNLIISHLMPPMPFKRGPVRSLLSAVNNNTVSSLIFLSYFINPNKNQI